MSIVADPPGPLGEKLTLPGPLASPRFEQDSETGEVSLAGEASIAAANLAAVFGTTDERLAAFLVKQVALTVEGAGSDAGSLNAAVATIRGVGPQDELEAMLASQMAAAHNLAMRSAARATNCDGEPTIGLEMDRAAKLMRVFAAQLEAFSRYRSKGQQRMVVEYHTKVEGGGQAVVGPVMTARARDGRAEGD